MRYQGIACDGELLAVEAKAYWQQSGQQLLPVSSFITTVEQLGLGGLLSEKILDTSLKHFSQCSPGEGVQLHLNLLPNDANSEDYPDLLLRKIQSHGLLPEQIVIEVSETLWREDAGKLEKVLPKLNEIGVSIAVADFGNSGVGFLMLRGYSVKRMKMAEEFTKTLATDMTNMAIVKGTLGFSRNVDIHLILTGVDQPGDIEHMKALGGECYQGDLYCPMLPANDFRLWLIKNKTQRVSSS